MEGGGRFNFFVVFGVGCLVGFEFDGWEFGDGFAGEVRFWF